MTNGDEDPSRHFVNLPWYTENGNHDMGKSDPCPCDGTGMYCHQTNNAAYPTWIMPHLTHHVPMPELNIEIIGLDRNFDWQGETCKYAYCGDSTTCYYNLLKRTAYAGTHFAGRYQESTAKTLVVFSHCPVDYLHCKTPSLSSSIVWPLARSWYAAWLGPTSTWTWRLCCGQVL